MIRFMEQEDTKVMNQHYRAIIKREDNLYVGYCLEDPQIKATGKSLEECRALLAAALQVKLAERPAETFRN